ncbi:hypothetical protein Scep_004308 [Stephania cephalantha]|uniref:Uncharacterized protein n=1 Tax=Stephania cephalantha TaxID=152367 RepID=A0AAP0PX72_9MAGN
MLEVPICRGFIGFQSKDVKGEHNSLHLLLSNINLWVRISTVVVVFEEATNNDNEGLVGGGDGCCKDWIWDGRDEDEEAEGDVDDVAEGEISKAA